MLTAERFFVTGGTLRPDAPSYVERRADHELREALLAGEFCYVLTSRQMGKSSLMVRTAARLRASGQRVVVLDLTAAGQNLTPEQWYRSLLDLAADQLDRDFEAYWNAHRHRGPLLRFLGALQTVAEPLVVFIDEIDAVQSLPFPTDELFAGIRECYNRRAQPGGSPGLTFCLLGVAMPSDLIRDARATPFNIGRRIELTDFTPAEAEPLTHGLAGKACEGEDSPRQRSGQARRLLERVLYWTGGHPYLTQRLCEATATLGSESQGKRGGSWWRGPETQVDRAAEGLFFAPGARKRDPNLHLVHERMLRGDADVAALLDLYRRVIHGHRVPDEATNHTTARLLLAGVARTDGHRLRPRNRIYARAFDKRWIVEHMPNAEARRQRAAFRSGLVRAGAISTVVLSLVGSLAGVAANEAFEATQLTRKLSESIAQKEEAIRKLSRAYAEIQKERNRARREATRAAASEAGEKRHRRTAEAMRAAAQAATRLAEAGHRDAVRLQAVAERQREENRERLVRVSVANGMRLATEGRPFDGLHWLAEALRLDDRHPAQAAAHRTRIASLLRQAPGLRQAWDAGGRPSTLAVSPDGSRAVATTLAGVVRIWDTHTGKQVGNTLDLEPRLRAVRFSRDGRHLLVATGACFQVFDPVTGIRRWPRAEVPLGVTTAEFSADGRRIVTGNVAGLCRVWDSETGRSVGGPLRHTGIIEHAVFSADGERIFVAEARGPVHTWRVADGTRLPLTLRVETSRLTASPDGRWLVVSQGHGALVFDARSGQLQMSIPDGNLHLVEFSPDSRRLLSASNGEVRLWDVPQARQIGKVMHHEQYVLALKFAPAGTGILTITSDGTVRNWELTESGVTARQTNLAGPAWAASFDRRGERVLLTRAEGLVQLWDLQEEGPLLRSHRPITRTHLAAAEDTRRFVVEDAEGRVSVRDAESGAVTATPVPSGVSASVLAVDATGSRFAVARKDRTLQTYDGATGRAAGKAIRTPALLRRLEFTGDGRLLLGRDEFGAVHLWDASTGTSLMSPIPTHHSEPAIALNRDGTQLAVVQHGYGVRVRTRGEKTVDRILVLSTVLDLAFSPDSKRLLIAGKDRTVQLWDTESLKPIGNPIFHDSLVNSVRFSADGQSIVICGENQSARVWGCDGTPRTPLLLHDRAVSCGAFSPNGAHLVTLTGDGKAQLWDARTGEALTVATPIGHTGGRCWFSRGGDRVLFALFDGEVHVWTPAQDVRPAGVLADLATAITSEPRKRTGGALSPARAAALWQRTAPPRPATAPPPADHESERSRHEAVRLEQAGAWAGAALHLDRVIAAVPGEVGLHLRRARARIEIGRYRDAADDLQIAIDLGTDTYLIYYEHALLLLAAGHREGYQTVCKRMLDRFSTGHLRERDLTAWTCSLGSNTSENLSRAETLARDLIPRESGNADYRHTLGVLLYRRGHYAEAAGPLREAVRLAGAGESTLAYHLHLALVLRKLGEAKQAGQLVEDARRRRAANFRASEELKTSWTDRLENELLDAELRQGDGG